MHPDRRRRFAWLHPLPLGLLAACQPELTARASLEVATAEIDLTVEPPADLANVPPVLRLHLRPSAAGPSLSEAVATSFVLVEGEVGKAQLRQLASGELSRALEERLVPVLRWRESDGHLVLGPADLLEPGARYTVASGPLGLRVELTVESSLEAPVLDRVWPPSATPAALGVALWCGPEPIAALALERPLEPDGPAGIYWSMASSVGRWAEGSEPGGCVWFEAGEPVERPSPEPPPGTPNAGASPVGEATGWLPAPAVGVPVEAFLDPRPLVAAAALPPAPSAACDGEEQPFGPGCALVADDRMRVRSPAEPLLWLVTRPEMRWAVATGPGDSFVVHPLPVAAATTLELLVLDTRAGVSHSTPRVETSTPAAHVVINEVLANPVGPEPAQEWIELYNDGLAPARLAGVELVDAGGVTTLPDRVLAPGGYALLVSEGFDPASEFDSPPAPDALLVRLAALGTNGLSNEGEPLLLRGADGQPWSRFPAEPKPRSGESVARVAPRAVDDAADAFVRSAGGPTPGRANGLAP